jgi:putative transposase
MARPLRLQIAGEFLHVLARGNARQAIFLDDIDRMAFLDILQSVVKGWGVRCHAYCLMGNHYHLLLQPSQANISSGLRQLNGVYGQEFNRRHGRVGHVFGGRFKGLLVGRDNYLVQIARYLALNPVRARLVATPEAWSWSHHRAMAGIAPAMSFLSRDEILTYFDSSDRGGAEAAYRRFVELGDDHDECLGNAIAQGGILGDEALRGRVSSAVDAFAAEREIPRRERFAHRPPLERVLDSKLDRDQRDERIREAYAVHHYTIGQISAQLGLGRSTISRALRRPLFSPVPEQ